MLEAKIFSNENLPEMIDPLNISSRIETSEGILKDLSLNDQKNLISQFLNEQVLEQRQKMHLWSTITNQPSQIDTGYISQHLVSLLVKIPGQTMRGKGVDLICGSEIKSANFLDSCDKKGYRNPRWNFCCSSKSSLSKFLEYKALYLVSFDFNKNHNIRVRVWSVCVKDHESLKNRYIEWLNELGFSKFSPYQSKKVANFQLFPPRTGVDENYARHGDDKQFDKIRIDLDNNKSSHLLLHAEEVDGKMKIIKI